MWRRFPIGSLVLASAAALAAVVVRLGWTAGEPPPDTYFGFPVR
jgi:hypothetical protein